VATGAKNGEPTNNWANVTQVAVAASAFVGIIASLALTGILGQGQRDHGVLLLIAFAFVLFAATLLVVAALLPRERRSTPPTPPEGGGVRTFFRRLSLRVWLEIVGVLLFGTGVLVGIIALIDTQQDAVRPAISASFDPSTSLITAKVTAEGLSASDRVVIRVDGLSERRKKGRLVYKAQLHALYLAALGPDADGNVSQEVSVDVPVNDQLVGVKAWTGEEDPSCYVSDSFKSENSAIPQAKQDACLMLRLPAPPASTSPRPPTLETKRLASRTKTANCRMRGSLPDRDCSPGAILVNATPALICKKGYSKTVRDVSDKMRAAIYTEYGLPPAHYGRAYQIDHIVPLGLGGSNDPANLWPQAGSPAPGYTVKDSLDRRLPKLVCNGERTLGIAQKAIARSWTALYAQVYDAGP
jgi:hypothetical protein